MIFNWCFNEFNSHPRDPNGALWLAYNVMNYNWLGEFYLNRDGVFLSRNYPLIVAPWKFDVVTNKYASFKNMKFSRGINSQGQLSDRSIVLYCLCTTKFSSARQSRNDIELFSTFLDESRDSQMKNLQKKTEKKH